MEVPEFYCKVCKAQMNSQFMWDSHISGKRHLKKAKGSTNPDSPVSEDRSREPSPAPNPSAMEGDENQPKEKEDEYDLSKTAKIEEAFRAVTDPVVGLDYMVELQYPDPEIHPSYSCTLCKCTVGVMAIIEHVTSTKHRMNFIVENDKEGRIILENMQSSGIPLDGLTEERTKALETKLGRGTVKVKIEKSKFGAIAGMRKRPQSSNSGDGISQKRTNFDYSSLNYPPIGPPGVLNPQERQFLSHMQYFDIETKLQILEELTFSAEITNDIMAKEAMVMITSLYNQLKKFKVAFAQQNEIVTMRDVPISYPQPTNNSYGPSFRPYGPRNFM